MPPSVIPIPPGNIEIAPAMDEAVNIKRMIGKDKSIPKPRNTRYTAVDSMIHADILNKVLFRYTREANKVNVV